VDVLHPVKRGDDGRSGVVHIGRVDQGRTGIEQRQAAAAGTFQHPFHELRVTRAPDDVRAHRRDPETRRVRGQRQQFGLGLRAGVVTVRADRVRRLGAQPGDGGPGIGHGRGGDKHQLPHTGLAGGPEQAARAFDIDLVELRGAAGEGDLRSQVDDAFGAGDCRPECLIVRD